MDGAISELERLTHALQHKSLSIHKSREEHIIIFLTVPSCPRTQTNYSVIG